MMIFELLKLMPTGLQARTDWNWDWKCVQAYDSVKLSFADILDPIKTEQWADEYGLPGHNDHVSSQRT